jgi:hypothetical protein
MVYDAHDEGHSLNVTPDSTSPYDLKALFKRQNAADDGGNP